MSRTAPNQTAALTLGVLAVLMMYIIGGATLYAAVVTTVLSAMALYGTPPVAPMAMLLWATTIGAILSGILGAFTIATDFRSLKDRLVG